MFVTINNQVYLKTGDLLRYNGRGELVHVDRVDFQIKIRGQRLKTNKIENTIMNFSPEKISNCLVVKAPQNDDLLVAYVITNGTELNTEQIRDYWKKHLRQYMVPSFFIMPDKLTLNVNDKVDRKQLLLLSLFSNAETNWVQVEDRSMSKLEVKILCL
jgi:acyl-CoA synthetase (AMP-forming)/AMP-acid ligase II